MSTIKKKDNKDLSEEYSRLEWVFDKGINFKDRIIQITGEIEDQSSFDYLDAALTELERDSKKSVILRINSPGGSVVEALAMVGRIKASKCHIVTEVYGQVMSAAVLLLASGDKRRMSKYAMFMHHQSSYSITGEHANIKEEVLQREREEQMWSEWMSELTLESKEFWYDGAHKTNLYLTASQCLEAGVIDELF